MSDDALKLTVDFGERDRVGRRLLADALIDICERHELTISLLLRELWGIIDRVTGSETVVTSEFVPAFRATSDGRAWGHLELGGA